MDSRYMVVCYVDLVRQKKNILTGFDSRTELRILLCCCPGTGWRHGASHMETKQTHSGFL